jgi:hypothetical protein
MPQAPRLHHLGLALSLALLGGLTACGGGLSGAGGDASPGVSPQAAVVSLSVEVPGEPLEALPALDAVEARPSFHAAPVLLDDPQADADAPAQTRLTAAQAAALTSAQAGAMTTTQVSKMETTDLASMTTTAVKGFSSDQIKAMDEALKAALAPKTEIPVQRTFWGKVKHFAGKALPLLGAAAGGAAIAVGVETYLLDGSVEVVIPPSDMTIPQ